MVLRTAMHHGWRALAMIGAATEGLAAVTGATMLHVATEGRASTLVTVVATMHVAIAWAAEVFLAVAVTLTRAAMALRMVALAAGFRAGPAGITVAARFWARTAGITIAARFWIRTALGLATACFGAALRAASAGLVTLRLRAAAFGIGAGIFTRGFTAARLGLGRRSIGPAGFRRRSGGGFRGFLGRKGGDAEGAKREQQETMAGFGFHGLEWVLKPWEAGRSWGATAP